MFGKEETVRLRIAAAHAEALKVGDSPLRADRVADQVQGIQRDLSSAGLDADRTARISSSIDAALRVLRRDDDGREAARHLHAALSLFDAPPPKKSPFAD